jgi:hypothetical protein
MQDAQTFGRFFSSLSTRVRQLRRLQSQCTLLSLVDFGLCKSARLADCIGLR